jgi:diguanylate cyclase (GGDEF)-like protein/PAS domain S-box-containing protein
MEPSVTITLPAAGPRPADYRELLSGSSLGFAVVDRLGRLVEVNRAFAQLLRSSISRLAGLSIQELTHPTDRGDLPDALRLLQTGEAAAATVETLLVDEEGQPRPVQAHLSAVSTDHGDYVLIAVVDLGSHRSRPATYAFAATHDPLTGLFNRAGMLARLDALVADGASASLVMLDVDRLDAVNLSHGYGAGDRLLHQVGAYLAQVAEPDGLACRLSGDEFVVIADTTDQIALGRYLTKELAELRVEVAPGVSFTATASVGVAAIRPGLTSSQVLATADESMYAVKQRRQAALDEGRQP